MSDFFQQIADRYSAQCREMEGRILHDLENQFFSCPTQQEPESDRDRALMDAAYRLEERHRSWGEYADEFQTAEDEVRGVKRA